jgi:hypothetical protein
LVVGTLEDADRISLTDIDLLFCPEVGGNGAFSAESFKLKGETFGQLNFFPIRE